MVSPLIKFHIFTMDMEEGSLGPSSLLSDPRYHRRTCGASAGLVRSLRLALSDKASSLPEFCDRLLAQLPTVDAAVIVAPALGPPLHVSSKGSSLTAAAADDDKAGSSGDAAVVWLLPDPLDIDTKQTTFVRSSDPESLFKVLYKLDDAPVPVPAAAGGADGSAAPPPPPPAAAAASEEQKEGRAPSATAVVAFACSDCTIEVSESTATLVPKVSEAVAAAAAASGPLEKVDIAIPSVHGAALERALRYCWYHARSSGVADREKRRWASGFLQLNPQELVALAAAAYHLEVDPLQRLAASAVAKRMTGCRTDEILTLFNLSEVSSSSSSPSSPSSSSSSAATSNMASSTVVDSDGDSGGDGGLNSALAAAAAGATQARRDQEREEAEQAELDALVRYISGDGAEDDDESREQQPS